MKVQLKEQTENEYLGGMCLGLVQGGEVGAEHHYYAFGLVMRGSWNDSQQNGSDSSSNRYKYNGKELNTELGLYEYGFRWYDPVIGRFTGVDPISDKFPHVSTYNYAENEPVGSIDLNGLQRLKVTGLSAGGRLYTHYPNTRLPNNFTQFMAILAHPIEAVQTGVDESYGSRNISTTAGRSTQNLGNAATIGEGGSGKGKNAFRHALWSAMINQSFGHHIWKDFTEAHEGVGLNESAKVDFSQPFSGSPDIADSVVDILNNAVGADIATANPEASAAELSAMILDVYSSEGLWTVTEVNGNISITRSKISKEQRQSAQSILDVLTEHGFTQEQLKQLNSVLRDSGSQTIVD